jgi:hypothetical protein
MQSSDRVLALARTPSGFLAAGEHAPGGTVASSPVIWTSPDGLSWQRLDARQLGLAAGGGRVLRISFAASHGGDTVIGGVIARTSVTQVGKKRQQVTAYSTGIWRSASGQTTWAAATVPVSNGAQDWIDGLAADGSGFVAIRAGATLGNGTAGVAYVSSDGSSWTYGGTITAAKTANLKITGVAGSDAGIVASGQVAGGSLVAYVSHDGRSWQPTAVLGSASAESVSGATIVPGGTVIAAGASAGDPVSQRPFLALAGAQRGIVNVDLGSVAGAAEPEVAVTGVAVGGGKLVAVGSAGGYPAVWSSTGSGAWSRGSGAAPGVLQRPGLQGLDNVAHGAAGWLAVGGVSGGTSQHPVVVTSADGLSWQAADGEGTFAAPGTFTAQAAAGPAGYVIVGEQALPAQTRISRKQRQVIPGRTVAAAWWSAGLSGWARAGDAGNGDLDGPGGPRQMVAVTASGRGFVAVGSAGGRPAAWTSADGRRWRAVGVPLPAGASGGTLEEIAARGSGVVAAGMAGAVPFAVVSGDGGTTWRAATLGTPGGAAVSPMSVTALVAAGTGFTMAGTSGSAGNTDVVLWSSADGNAWKASTPPGTGLSGPGVQEITALTASGSALTGAGFTATPLGEQPTLWKTLSG